MGKRINKPKLKKRKFNIICRWIILSFVVQTGILFYLSNYYFSDKTEVTFNKTTAQPSKAKSVDFELPKGAEEVELSSSGKYISYYLDKELHVVNLVKDEDNIVDLGDKDNFKNVFVKWYESDDRLIIAEKKRVNGRSGIKIYTYEAKDNTKLEALDHNNESKIYTMSNNTSKVEDIKLNTLNTIIYIKTSDYNGKYINRLDISTKLSKLPIRRTNIGDYYVIRQLDQIVFDDTLNKRVNIFDSRRTKSVKIDGVNRSKLLYVDAQGNVYIGKLQGDKVSSIYYKDCSLEDEDNWNKIDLKKPEDPENINIFGQNYMYVVDKQNSTVINLKNGKQTDIKGEFLDIKNNDLLSVKDNKVILEDLK